MSRRLLLVDDAPDIRAIAGVSLERVGDWSVVTAASGQEAIDALAHDGPFDAVVLDVMMPGMDGPATLAGLRRRGLGGAPVVFLTAKTQASERRRLEAMGVAGVIFKPFDPIAMPSELDRIVAGGDH
ncbi:MAG TPA: response regulator [Solirubrobacteraceae bacterium]|nr:response regulator [Solirubrobacteraceae bacterium]